MNERVARVEADHRDEIPETSSAASIGPPASTTGPLTGPPPQPPRKTPKRRRLFRAFLFGGGVVALLVGSAFGAAEYTSRSTFCDSCHEMEAYYATWSSSTHGQAECVDCHVPPGVAAFIKTKLFSFREIWVHLTQHLGAHPEPPLAVTRDISDVNCLKCHRATPNVDVGAVPFSHSQHTGASCLQCHARLVHRGIRTLTYRDPSKMSSCLACHDGAVAAGQCSTCHSPPHEARGECSSCHDLESWSTAGSKHTFPRQGAHAGLDCTDCHVPSPQAVTIPGTSLAKASPACVSCHGDQHGGLTECGSCHTPTRWGDVSFKHPLALTGAHAALGCADCHGASFRQVSASCVSCHGARHGGLTKCASCHTTQAWKPSTFRHQRVGEHIPSGEHRLSCSSCHKSGFATATCTPCHGGTPSQGDD